MVTYPQFDQEYVPNSFHLSKSNAILLTGYSGDLVEWKGPITSYTKVVLGLLLIVKVIREKLRPDDGYRVQMHEE
jgi:hypothetical protein